MLDAHKHVYGLTAPGLVLLGIIAAGAVPVAYFVAKPTGRAWIAVALWILVVAAAYGVLRFAGA
jgi:hypothetical protein